MKTSRLKYRDVAKALRQEILSGTWPLGQRLPGEMLLARRFNVAHMTMRQAINCLVEESVLVRLPAKGTYVVDKKLDEVKRTTARPLVLLFPADAERRDPYYFPDVLAGFQEAMSVRGHQFSLVGYIKGENFGVLEPDSAIACLLIDPAQAALIEALRDHRYSVLAINRYTGRRVVPSVYIDDASGVAEAVDHLVSLGHRSIAFVKGPPGNVDARERLRGFRSAAARHNLTHAPEVGKGFREANGYDAVRQLLHSSEPVTAAVFASDLAAVGGIRAAREMGRSIPAQFSVVGFGDFTIADYVLPRLTTVRQARHDLGAAAAVCLIELANNEPVADAVIPAELIVRHSAVPPA